MIRIVIHGTGSMAGAIAAAALPRGDVSITALIGPEAPGWETELPWYASLQDLLELPDLLIDFTLPDVNRNIVTAGFGLDVSAKTHIDVAAWYLIPSSRETADEELAPREKGEYEVQAWVLSLGVNQGF